MSAKGPGPLKQVSSTRAQPPFTSVCSKPGLLLVIKLGQDPGEVMVSGVTGEEFAADIFIGPVYYQRLRHMVSDKFQVSGWGKSLTSSVRQQSPGMRCKATSTQDS